MTTSLDAILGEQAADAANTPSTETVVEAAPVPATPADNGQARDENGRFKGKEGEAEPPAKTDTEPNKEAAAEPEKPEANAEGEGKSGDGKVPHGALHAARMKAHEERQRREAAERRLAEYEQRFAQPAPQQVQQPTPMTPEDRLTAFLADPDAFLEAELQKRLQPLQQTLSVQQERQSEMWAVKDHGAQTVDDAKLAALELQEQGGPAFDLLVTRLKASPHPFDELVTWHKEQAAIRQYGSDPQAYINAEVERLLAERMGQAPQQQPPAAQKPNTQAMPSSFANARNAGPRGGQGYGGPRPLSEILPS